MCRYCGADVGIGINSSSVWSISQLLISTDKSRQDGKGNAKGHSHKKKCGRQPKVKVWQMAEGEFAVGNGKIMSATWQEYL
jgi:hypothetical protein